MRRREGYALVGTVENRTSAFERAFSEIKRLSLSGLEGPELLRRTAEGPRRVVPFGSYCVGTVDPASMLITQVVNGGRASEGGHAEAYGDVLTRTYFEEDVLRLASMLRERRPAEPLSEAGGGVLDRSLRYREYLKPGGFGHELTGLFTDGGLWGAGYFTRDAGEPDFGRGEISLLKRIAPHVGAALKAAALRSRATDGTRGSDVPGVISLDREGSVLSYTPAAEHLLSEVEDLHPPWQHDAVPVPIRMAAGALKRALNPASDGDLNLVPKVRLRGRSARWLTLHASLTESTGERPSETVVVIAPSEPEEVARLNVASFGLTPREEEIAKLVARGCSTKEISRALFISEHTVNNHLRSIFEKAGVHSRRELVKRLFFEDLLSGVLGN
jgi:DNA-binding CsgD family transcriptional regulator